MIDETLKKAMIERFTKGPFFADKVDVSCLDGMLPAIVESFQVPEEDIDKLRSAGEAATGPDRGEVIELHDGKPQVRRTLALVPIDRSHASNGSRYFVIILKEEKRTSEEIERRYSIDQYYLDVARLTADKVLQGWRRPLTIRGWVDDVADDIVRFCYYDERGCFFHAEASRDRFDKISQLGSGEEFLIQTWEEAGEPRIDFLPLSEEAKEKISRVRMTPEEATRALPDAVRRALKPPVPRDWSDKVEVLDWLRRLWPHGQTDLGGERGKK